MQVPKVFRGPSNLPRLPPLPPLHLIHSEGTFVSKALTGGRKKARLKTSKAENAYLGRLETSATSVQTALLKA